MKDLRALLLFSTSCFFVAGFGLEAQPTSAASGDSSKGKIIYEANCLVCHGARGKGDGLIGATLRPPPADLTGSKARAKSDKDMLTVIQDGRAAMPAWKTRLNEQDLQNVLAYIRSLSE
jgi:mono/diheme cytochrome c family protein